MLQQSDVYFIDLISSCCLVLVLKSVVVNQVTTEATDIAATPSLQRGEFKSVSLELY